MLQYFFQVGLSSVRYVLAEGGEGLICGKPCSPHFSSQANLQKELHGGGLGHISSLLSVVHKAY